MPLLVVGLALGVVWGARALAANSGCPSPLPMGYVCGPTVLLPHLTDGFDIGPVNGRTVVAALDTVPQYPGSVPTGRAQPVENEQRLQLLGYTQYFSANAGVELISPVNHHALVDWYDKTLTSRGWHRESRESAGTQGERSFYRSGRRRLMVQAFDDFGPNHDQVYQLRLDIAPYPCGDQVWCGPIMTATAL